MLTIILDMDDVICNLFDEWLARYNKDYSDNKQRQEFITWEMSKVVKCGIKIYDYLMDESLYTCLKPIKWAKDITKKWIKQGHVIIVATRVHDPIAAKAKIKWMQEHFPHLVCNMHIVTGNTKHHLKGDVMIDDGLHNFEGFEGLRFVFDQPWNQCEYTPPHVRVSDWYELDLVVQLLDFLRRDDLIEQPSINTIIDIISK